MNKLTIKNGNIYDPLNNIKGEQKDLLIEDGKIVSEFSSQENVKEIDATGKTVVPSAIEIHSHIASQQLNWIRLIGSNKKSFRTVWERLTLQSIARNYISNGYTFLLDANVYPSLARQTILDLIALPVLDKGFLLNAGNLWPLEGEFEKSKVESLAYFLSDLLSSTKAFGIKIYNPFESENWNFKEMRNSINQGGKLYNFKSIDIYNILVEAVEYLQLPHSVQAHIEGYELETGRVNLKLLMEELKEFQSGTEKISPNHRNQILHLPHASSYSQDGTNKDLIDYVNENDLIDLDLGIIGFEELNPLITSDRRLMNHLVDNNQIVSPIIKNSVEFEGDFFSGFRKFEKSNPQHCNLWENAIELALEIQDKWKVQLSVNFPHYAHINSIPEIATWLISKKARIKFMNDMNSGFLKDSNIQSNDKELDFNEYVIISRASPAKSLGVLEFKGTLSEGADADVNILDIDLTETDISKDYERFKEALENIEYVIKGGKIIKKQQKIDLQGKGKIFWTEGKINSEEREKAMKSKREFYQKYYSYFYDNLKNEINEKNLKKV
ncbi:MAG: amidohydrolase family protein [Candidatus Lokiarchaeota archaeon]|nr:amidohydrolase family protein [Candidatus Lokiarchaeota archaeon]MBD3202031.1 amidohydrolase family protein [Candidatus Lokiarchaeota archaeon]